MASSSASPALLKFNLKLLIDTGASKVLYAEVDKDFVDFLFSLLMLPIASVVRVLSKDGMVGCLGELYGSMESFTSTHFIPNIDRLQFLRPIPSYSIGQRTLAMLRYDGLSFSAGIGASGFVKGGEATYMVTDGLVVSPFSTTSVIRQLKNVSDGVMLEERNVEFGMEEGIKLLRASLGSKTVLSDVFVEKKNEEAIGHKAKTKPPSLAFASMSF